MAEKSARTLIEYLHQVAGPAASDRDLLAQFVEAGDEAAFAALVRRHGPTVWGVCRRILNNEADAEDAFQATFVVLAREAGRLRPPFALSAWLYGVARRVSLKARGRLLRQQRTPPEPARPSSDPLDVLTARELLNILDGELLALPEEYRSPLILCCLEGKSREEAAEQLGWTPGSVKGRLERGRDLLAQRLARKGVTLPAALGAVLAWKSVGSAMPAFALAGAGLSASVLALVGQAGTGPLVWLGRIVLAGCVVVSLGVGGVVLLSDRSAPPAPVVANSPEAQPEPEPAVIEEPQLPPPVVPVVIPGDVMVLREGSLQLRPRATEVERIPEKPRVPPREVLLTPETQVTWAGDVARLADLHTEQHIRVTLAEDDRTALAIEIVTAKRVGKPDRRGPRKGWFFD